MVSQRSRRNRISLERPACLGDAGKSQSVGMQRDGENGGGEELEAGGWTELVVDEFEGEKESFVVGGEEASPVRGKLAGPDGPVVELMKIRSVFGARKTRCRRLRFRDARV